MRLAPEAHACMKVQYQQVGVKKGTLDKHTSKVMSSQPVQ